MTTEYYLVIWQLGDNIQSQKATPLDVVMDISKYRHKIAEYKYDRIIQELKYITGESGFTILSITKF
jgi:hypothetical protein